MPGLLARFDINLAPPEAGNAFCRAKSEIKYVEAALVKAPTVASRTEAFEFALGGGTGVLAETGAEWAAARGRELLATLNEISARRRGEPMFAETGVARVGGGAAAGVCGTATTPAASDAAIQPGLLRRAVYALRYRGGGTLLRQAAVWLRQCFVGLVGGLTSGARSPAAEPTVPPTVALVSSYPLHVGGVETHLLTLLRRGDSSRRRLLIGPVSPQFAAQARAAGAEVIGWSPKGVSDFFSALALARLLRRHGVGLVHFHCLRAAVMARPLTKLLSIPAVVTVHLPLYYFTGGTVSAGFGRRLYLRLERSLNFRCTDRLIYASRAVMREADALGLIPRYRAVFIGNGIDLARYADGGSRRSARAKFGVGDDERGLCSVGRLEEQKGVDVLLEAFSRLDVAALRARLWVIGDGALRQALMEQACRLGITDRVQFLGFRRDGGRLLAAADVFVMASRYEAMPLAVIEAMASGLPCVVTNAGEQGAMVEDEVNGLVVPVGDAGALSRALERLLADAGLCREMGRASRRKAACYDEREAAARVEEVYALIAQRRQS